MLPFTPPIRPQKKRNSTPAVVALSICIFFLFAVIFAQATFKLTFLQPDTSEETLIFAARFGADFPAVRRADVCLAAHSAAALCRAQDRSSGFEISQSHGAGRIAAFAGTGDLPLPVLLRTAQPLHREMVLPAGGRCAVPHQRHHLAADRVCCHQRPR